MKDLAKLGWSPFFEDKVNESDRKTFKIGRVIEQQKNLYKIAGEAGQSLAALAGRFHYNSLGAEDYPCVGDFVLFRQEGASDTLSIIERVVDRKSCLKRKIAGNTSDSQLMAVNADSVWITTSLNDELNPRRIERYLTAVWDSGAEPVLILNKADLCENTEEILEQLKDVTAGIKVHVVSALNGEGLKPLLEYFVDNKTVAIAGSSGVGKSTLINSICGNNDLATSNIRESDSMGRHTTTARSMIFLPTGGMIIDTPGIRELGIVDESNGLETSFEDIVSLEPSCQFSDCRHETEPNCAILAAIAEGTLDPLRLRSYNKQKRERKFIQKSQTIRETIAEKRKLKQFSKHVKSVSKKRKNARG